MQSKIKITLNIDKNILQSIKLIALNKEKTQTEIITEFLKTGINNEKNNKKNTSLKEVYGIFKASEPFDSVEEIKKIEKGE